MKKIIRLYCYKNDTTISPLQETNRATYLLFPTKKKSKNQHGFPTPSFVCFLFSTRLSRSAAAAVAASKGENNIIVVGLVGSEGGTIMV